MLIANKGVDAEEIITSINNSQTLNNNFSSDSEEETGITNSNSGACANNTNINSTNFKVKSSDSDTNTDSDLEEIRKCSEEDKIYEGDFLNSLFKLQKFMDSQNKQIRACKDKTSNYDNLNNNHREHKTYSNKEYKVYYI